MEMKINEKEGKKKNYYHIKNRHQILYKDYKKSKVKMFVL